jgi:hypothetical protein
LSAKIGIISKKFGLYVHIILYLGLKSKPMAKRGRKSNYPIYQWDIDGNLIYRHATLEMAVENLLIDRSALYACLRRQNCYQKKWYFSRTADFVIPKKKFTHNPLLKKYQYYGEIAFERKDFDDDLDF